jgi:hypothetical protein
MYKNNNELAITSNLLTLGPLCLEFPNQGYYKRKNLIQNMG